ncbi:MAG: tRNA (adenosine(37)-N6)-dimethylallyltransferase MiaA [Balneolaceae bacterium]
MIKRLMILGPTASGKSALSARLAGEIGAEIISVDSRQCYKKIDIGTAKPEKELLDSVPHYNISLFDLNQNDSAANFFNRTRTWEKQILSKGRYVIYTGGSTLHLQGLIRPLDDLPQSNPENIRQLNQQVKHDGLQTLYQELQRVDPDYAEKMDGLNRQRIIRAMDVWMQTGKPFSSFHRKDEIQPPDDMIVYGLHWLRKKLHERINQRVDTMIEKGLIEETRQILEEGYSPDLQSLQTVGYREVISYLDGNLSKEDMINDIKTKTRRYAKRQITWFRRWPFIRWLKAYELSVAERIESIKQDLAADPNKS